LGGAQCQCPKKTCENYLIKKLKIMPFMYILECANGSFYTGSTWNLEKRLWDHQTGQGAIYTKSRLPVKLVYCEEYKRIDEAYFREKQIQGWSRRKKKALINLNEEKLIEYSKNHQKHK
jgi:putative endonuclease